MNALYAHIPYCQAKCRYCDFNSGRMNEDEAALYVDALIKHVTQEYVQWGPFDTVYVGGGTPTFLPFPLLEKLMSALATKRKEDGEFTVEGNPATITKEKADLLANMGVNRVSMGVQTFNTARLDEMGRLHEADHVVLALSHFRNAGISNLSLDLIHSWPGQTAEDLSFDLESLLALEVPHSSIYGLIYEEPTPLGQQHAAGEIHSLSEDEEVARFSQVIDTMTNNGFQHYEVAAFGRPGFRSLHNLNYWQNGNYAGVGVSAHGYQAGIRGANTPSVAEYIRRIKAGQSPRVTQEKLTGKAKAGEVMMLGLRLLEGFTQDWFEAQTGNTVEGWFGETLARLVDLGFIASDGKTVKLTHKGLMVADTVMAEFVNPQESSAVFHV